MLYPSEFLKDQIPSQVWPIFPTVFRTAYAAAEDLAKSDPILQVESAKDNKGRLISWAVDFGLKRAIDSGLLPFTYAWKSFAKPTGRYLELRLSHSTASVSQVENPKFQPRSVVFRENARLRSPGLFPEIDKAEAITGTPHFLIVHGYQELTFA